MQKSLIHFDFVCDPISARHVVNQILHPRYNDIAIATIKDLDENVCYRVAFFHNDKVYSQNGRNDIDIYKVKNMIINHVVDKVVCCYAYNTGIKDKYLLLPAAKFGEIRTGCNNGINYLSK